MKISSRATYLFPFLLLIITSLLMGLNMLDYTSDMVLIDFDILQHIPLLFLMAIFTAGTYFLFRKITGKLNRVIVQVLAIFLPTIIQIIYHLLLLRIFHFEVMYVIEGLLLLWALKLLSSRYMATLTDVSIELVNLLDQHLSVALTAVTKLEQKKQVFSLLKELSFLNISRKTGISFTDENLDEFEVNIFTKAFNYTEIFDKIIDRANQCGNFKIRQYTI